jgi:hypothetical protein
MMSQAFLLFCEGLRRLPGRAQFPDFPLDAGIFPECHIAGLRG